MRPLRQTGLVLCLTLVLSAGQAFATDWFDRYGRAPAGHRVYVCHGYSCRIITPTTLSAAEIDRIAAPLLGAVNAPAERQALSHSVALFEAIVGSRAGTSGDMPAMRFGGGRDGQMDCIDEATNTTSLLRILAGRGALKFHTVLQPTARGFFLDGRYPHATAVLAEAATGQKWSVDSWPHANGEPPVIMPLSAWFRQRTSALPS
jgi:hypothetical protein